MPSLPQLRDLEFWSKEFSQTIQFDRVALAPEDGTLQLLSFIGSASTVKAIFANLVQGEGVTLRFLVSQPLSTGHFWKLRRDDVGYAQHRTHLGYHLYHCVLVTKAKGFMPSLTDDALWAEVQRDRFATPVMRHWMPALRDDLIARGRLVRSACIDCDCGVLTCSSEEMDEAVKDGLCDQRYLLEVAA
jgi:hypothetical protein